MEGARKDFLNKYKKYNYVHLVVAISYLVATLFILLYGYKGMNATEQLIKYNEITHNELLDMIKNFWFIIIILFGFSAITCGYCYWIVKKFLTYIPHIPGTRT